MFGGFVSGHKNIRLAGISLAPDSCYDPIRRTDNVTTFECINPAVIVEHSSTPFSFGFFMEVSAGNIWMPEVSDDFAFARLGWNFASILEWTHHIVLRMIAVFVPLSRLNHDWLFPEF